MNRKIVECRYSITPVEVEKGFAHDPTAWLGKKASAHGLTTLLAHADDGVIWGRVEGERLVLSSQAFPKISPLLRAVTLQQARLFGDQAELLVWRDGEGKWHARLLDEDGTEKSGWYFNEPQLQWGDHIEDEKDGFTLVAEGQEGLRHAVPLAIPNDLFEPPDWHPLRLEVRHYLELDEEVGTLIIARSRLAGLWAEEWKEGSDE